MKYVIVGAGVAGLSVAYKLLERGHQVLVLEKESDIGGLARSFRYGSFIFDIGPHRFFTDEKEVDQFVRSVLAQDYTLIDRRNSICLLNKYYRWPFRPDILVKLPLPVLLKAGFDLFSRPKFEGPDFKSSIIRRYGITLYNFIFKDYTEKFCHIPCERLSNNWIKASLDKAIIDKRLRMDSLFDILKMTYRSMGLRTRFLYPKGGCGRFAHNLAKLIREKKGKIVTDVDDISIDFKNNRINFLRYDGQDKGGMELDHLIYTAPITQIAQQLNLAVSDLEYLNSIVFNIELNRPLKNQSQWIYFGDSDLSFVRVSFPRNFDTDSVPYGKDSLCAEVTCKDDSLSWHKPESLRERIIEDLIRIDLCQRKDIDNIHIEKIPRSYPLYKLNYLEELENTKKRLDVFENLTCLGRTGTFWYNNMDESIKMALEAADSIG